MGFEEMFEALSYACKSKNCAFMSGLVKQFNRLHN